MYSGLHFCGAAADDTDSALKDLDISLWDLSGNLRSSVGYKDNVLLSDADAKGSGFVDNGCDVTILRLPLDDWEFHFLLTGDDIRYWRGDMGVNHEDVWSVITELKRSFGDNWKLGTTFQYTYTSQVIEVNDTPFNVHEPPTNVVGHTFTLRPAVERGLGSHAWVRLEMEGTRQFLTDPADSYTLFGPRVVFGYNYGHRSELTLTSSVQEKMFDHLQDADPGTGVPLDGAPLRGLWYRETLASKHYWDIHRHWQTLTKLSFEYFQDNGASYYNYYQYGVSEELRYSANNWEITGSVGFIHDDYPIQTVSGDGTPLFRYTTLTAEVRVEKNLTKSLKFFVDYQNDTTMSDSVDQTFHSNTIMAGLDWGLAWQ